MREIFLCPDGGRGIWETGGAVCVGKWGKNVREGLKKWSRGMGKARREKHSEKRKASIWEKIRLKRANKKRRVCSAVFRGWGSRT